MGRRCSEGAHWVIESGWSESCVCRAMGRRCSEGAHWVIESGWNGCKVTFPLHCRCYIVCPKAGLMIIAHTKRNAVKLWHPPRTLCNGIAGTRSALPVPPWHDSYPTRNSPYLNIYIRREDRYPLDRSAVSIMLLCRGATARSRGSGLPALAPPCWICRPSLALEQRKS